MGDMVGVAKQENFGLTTDGACEADRPAYQKKNKKFIPSCVGVSTPSIHPFKSLRSMPRAGHRLLLCSPEVVTKRESSHTEWRMRGSDEDARFVGNFISWMSLQLLGNG